MQNEVTLKLTGITPLLMHNTRLADPLDPYAVRLSEAAAKRKKTTADHQSIARIEWEGGLYWDSDHGPFIPGWNVVRSIRDGAALSKQGRDVLRAVICPHVVPVQYDGPRDLDGMWDAGMRDRRAVTVGRARTIRTRPRFDNWVLVAHLEYDDEMINQKDLVAAAEKAGQYAGIGDYRPSAPKGGQFGRYEVTTA